VFAIVEHEQEPPVPRELEQRVEHREPRFLLDANHAGDGLRNEARIGDGRQFDQPDAVGVVVERVRRHLQRQAGLAEAAASQQRQQAHVAEQRPHFRKLALAGDKWRQLSRQVVGRRLERAQRRELRAQTRMDDLMNALRFGKVAQAYRPQVAQRHPLGQPAVHQRRDRLRACRDEVRRRFGFMALTSGTALELTGRLEHDRDNFHLRTPCLTR